MTLIKEIYSNKEQFENKQVVLKGWVRNNRSQKSFGFIDFHDGSFFNSIQVVYEDNLENFNEISKFRVGSSLRIEGTLVLTPNARQPFEIKALSVSLLGDSPSNYPIQPKRHSREFLRELPHLRPRTNLFQAVFRLRSVAAHAIHTFFQEKGFVYTHSPIITDNDGEGAGQQFTVTTLPLDNIPKENNNVLFNKDFFGKHAHLTVTGQLEGESYAMAFRNIYTFGPTFRAENSHTPRHASEFWMIEPEMAFADLSDNMDIAEEMVKYIIKFVYEKLPEEMAFFNQFVDKNLKEKLENVLNKEFVRITHKEAIDILIKSGEKFAIKPQHGHDLATEHEKFLTEKHFNSPVFVKDWPKDIKAFYMKLNDDQETVAAMDLLVPGSGELIGGSQREENADKLLERMEQMNVPIADLEWYVDLRRYGGCVHSGFGLGFERLIMYLTGVENIRDVIPFPRTPGNI